MSGKKTRDVHVFRYVAVDSPVHRLWAGTKLLTVAGAGIALSLRPEWPAIAMVGALVLAGALVARLPRGVLPRVPQWFVVLLLLGGLLAALASTQPPHVTVLGISWSGGALEQWARFFVLGVVLLAAAALVTWTTNMAELAPAIRTLLTPLGWLRVPVDDMAVTIALCARCLPLLLDDSRTMLAARRLRPRPYYESRRARFRAEMREPVDLLVASLTVSLRRAHELADAMEARGGTANVTTGRSRLAGRDVIALVVVAAVLVVAIAVPV